MKLTRTITKYVHIGLIILLMIGFFLPTIYKNVGSYYFSSLPIFGKYVVYSIDGGLFGKEGLLFTSDQISYDHGNTYTIFRCLFIFLVVHLTITLYVYITKKTKFLKYSFISEAMVIFFYLSLLTVRENEPFYCGEVLNFCTPYVVFQWIITALLLVHLAYSIVDYFAIQKESIYLNGTEIVIQIIALIFSPCLDFMFVFYVVNLEIALDSNFPVVPAIVMVVLMIALIIAESVIHFKRKKNAPVVVEVKSDENIPTNTGNSSKFANTVLYTLLVVAVITLTIYLFSTFALSSIIRSYGHLSDGTTYTIAVYQVDGMSNTFVISGTVDNTWGLLPWESRYFNSGYDNFIGNLLIIDIIVLCVHLLSKKHKMHDVVAMLSALTFIGFIFPVYNGENLSYNYYNNATKLVCSLLSLVGLVVFVIECYRLVKEDYFTNDIDLKEQKRRNYGRIALYSVVVLIALYYGLFYHDGFMFSVSEPDHSYTSYSSYTYSLFILIVGAIFLVYELVKLVILHVRKSDKTEVSYNN